MQANTLPSQSVTVIFQGGINVHRLGQGGDDGGEPPFDGEEAGFACWV